MNSNRIYDNYGDKIYSKAKICESFSVDTEADLKKVEKYLKNNKQNYKYLKKLMKKIRVAIVGLGVVGLKRKFFYLKIENTQLSM